MKGSRKPAVSLSRASQTSRTEELGVYVQPTEELRRDTVVGSIAAANAHSISGRHSIITFGANLRQFRTQVQAGLGTSSDVRRYGH